MKKKSYLDVFKSHRSDSNPAGYMGLLELSEKQIVTTATPSRLGINNNAATAAANCKLFKKKFGGFSWGKRRKPNWEDVEDVMEEANRITNS